jgi:drug/metabolite transporter (DMT)-like permease
MPIGKFSSLRAKYFKKEYLPLVPHTLVQKEELLMKKRALLLTVTLVLAMAAIILLGTVAAFSLFLQGVADIGAVKASMLTVLEPLSATFFSAVWLGTKFSATDLVGFACILAIIFLLAKEE